jgi:RNA polymerase sigma-70 factor (ECF subfamily)
MPATSARPDSPHAKSPQPAEADSQTRPEELMTAAQGGDKAALDRLLAYTRVRFFPLAMRVLGDPDEAEDAMQDALVKVWRYLDRFEGRSALSTWLHRIVVNAALDRLRRRPPLALSTADSDERDQVELRVTSADNPEHDLARAQTGMVVREAMGRLSLAHGEALRLCDLEGESYAAIAMATRCPVGTVMSRLYHARRNLAAELTDGATSDDDLEALLAA